MKENKFNTWLVKGLDFISKSCTEKLSVLQGVGEFFILNIIIVVLAFFAQGIKESLFEGFFELFVAVSLAVLIFLNVKIKLKNGLFGFANVFYFAMGILAVYSLDMGFLDLGRNVVFGVWYLTGFSMAYIIYKNWRIKKGKWAYQ